MIKFFVIIVLLIGGVVLFVVMSGREGDEVGVSNELGARSKLEERSRLNASEPSDNTNVGDDSNSESPLVGGFVPPISQAKKRVTKKPFGIKITPENSPISPEQFSGYHTGTDFEIFPEEEKADVPVMAICKGTIQEKRTIAGYGGVVIQTCEYRGEIVSVLYGHLRIASVKQKIGDELFPGKSFAVLGTGSSAQTSGERKHLHLGIIKGTRVDVRGYVQRESELAGWIDPMVLVTP